MKYVLRTLIGKTPYFCRGVSARGDAYRTRSIAQARRFSYGYAYQTRKLYNLTGYEVWPVEE